MGTLYVVATPIGNLEDITLRALRVLREVALIAAEDTRETRKLLARYDVATPVTSYFEHNKLTKLEYLLDFLRTNDVALVSEAGMPGISDPGYELIRAALAADLPVVPIPGPSAVVTALAISGLSTDQFVYLGFLPRRPRERRARLADVAGERRTLVAFESPHRLLESLADVRDLLGERRIAVASELTKLYERVWRGTASEVAHQLALAPPRGEYTLVIEGASALPAASEAEVREQLERLTAGGVAPKEAVARVALATGRSRREVYRLLLAIRKCDKI